MNNLEALILGIVQGFTEFLPVSSSGHLTLLQHFFGFQDMHRYLFFDAVCHLGTLLSIFIIFAKDLALVFKNRTLLIQILLATLPLFPAALFIKQIEALFDSPAMLGVYFLLTALILSLGIRLAPKKEPAHPSPTPLKDAIWIGLAQVVALLPGVSRSGTTISAARALGWGYENAVRFSFFIAIPAILGATCLQLLRLFFSKEMQIAEVSPFQYAIAFVSSFICGTLALWFLKQLGTKKKFRYFAWYCAALGVVALLVLR